MGTVAATLLAIVAPHVLELSVTLLVAHGVPRLLAGLVVNTAAKKILGKAATVAGAAVQAGAEQVSGDLRQATGGKINLAFDRELTEQERRVAQPTKYRIPPGLGTGSF